MEKLKVVELKEICKKRGLSTSGKKSDLIERIQKANAPPVKALKHIIPKESQVLVARRNEKGFYIHEPTMLIFNPETRHVMGKWKEEHLSAISLEEKIFCEEQGLIVEDKAIEKNFSSVDRYEIIMNEINNNDNDED